MQLVKSTDPVLHKKAAKVVTFDTSLRQLVSKLATVMISNNGIGIAAPQVGLSKRILLVRTERFKVEPLINPEIIWQSNDTLVEREGCLSFPGQFFEVERPRAVHIRYCDINGKVKIFKDEEDEYFARVAQHEIDHLNGITYLDRAAANGQQEKNQT